MGATQGTGSTGFFATRWKRVRKVYAFVTPTVCKYVVLRAVLGVFQFTNEILLSFCLLSFFSRMGTGINFASARLGWLNDLPMVPFMTLLAVCIVLRGVMDWNDNNFHRRAVEGFRLRHRQRLLSWLFHNKSISNARFFSLWDDQTAVTHNTLDACFVALRNLVIGGLLFAALLYLSASMTLGLIVVLGVFSLPLRRVSNVARREGEATNLTNKGTRMRLMMSAKNLLLLRIHGMVEGELKFLNEKLGESFDQAQRHGGLSAFVGAYVYLMGTAFIILMAFFRGQESAISAAHLIPYLYLLNRFLTYVMSLFSVFPRVRLGLPILSEVATWWANHADDGVRGAALYRRPTERPFATLEKPLGWSLKSVSFLYDERSEPVVKNLDLTIRPGSAVAFVGESGAGKSTLLGLLIGELDPTSGALTVRHKQETRTLVECRRQILKHVGYVGGESFIFGGSLRENLLYGNTLEVSDRDLREALEQAQCQFILELPKGLDHPLTDQGQGLSMGQKQRLCLARALLRKPLALILDEATANLDVETEKNLVRLLADLKGKVTILSATHRKGFLKLADEIIELPSGSARSARRVKAA